MPGSETSFPKLNVSLSYSKTGKNRATQYKLSTDSDSWEIKGCYPIEGRHEHTSSYSLSRIVSVLASREVGEMEHV